MTSDSIRLKRVSAAEQVYVCCFTEVVPHLHIHLIPRAPGAEVRGPGMFTLLGEVHANPDRAVPIAQAADLAARMKRALKEGE